MQLGLASELGYAIIRNNVFRNISGSGSIVFLSSGNGANHHDIQIYNNVFYCTDPLTYNVLSPGVIWAESDRDGRYSNVRLDNLLVANNTFYNLKSSGSGISGSIILECAVSNNYLINNVWEDCRLTGNALGFSVESNNAYYNNTLNPPVGTVKQVNGTATTFVNAKGADFRLAPGGYAIGKGRNYPSTINAFVNDATNMVRGGVWDIGAYQFQTTGDVAPSNAQITVR
jgi:hypothetical protein